MNKQHDEQQKLLPTPLRRIGPLYLTQVDRQVDACGNPEILITHRIDQTPQKHGIAIQSMEGGLTFCHLINLDTNSAIGRPASTLRHIVAYWSPSKGPHAMDPQAELHAQVHQVLEEWIARFVNWCATTDSEVSVFARHSMFYTLGQQLLAELGLAPLMERHVRQALHPILFVQYDRNVITHDELLRAIGLFVPTQHKADAEGADAVSDPVDLETL